jgi:hypothetical protein
VPVQKHQISAAKTKKEPWNRRLPVLKKKRSRKPAALPAKKKRSRKPAVCRPKKSVVFLEVAVVFSTCVRCGVSEGCATQCFGGGTAPLSPFAFCYLLQQ